MYTRAKNRLLADIGIDLLHFPGNTINPIELNLPAVLNLHDLQHRHFPQYFTKAEIDNREKWWSASARRANALIAASTWIADDLHAQLRRGKIENLRRPRANAARDSAEPSLAFLAELRRRLKLPISFFIYPAAAWPHKNHDRLLRAFAMAQLPGVQLLLTGGGQEDSPLPGLIESLGLTGRVRLMGRVSTEDLAGLYRLATALIFPSQYEAWSLPIAEAMQAGCPVASSDVPSLPEQVGDAGLLFPADDVDAMASALRQLAEDEELPRRWPPRASSGWRNLRRSGFSKPLPTRIPMPSAAHSARRAA